MNREFFMIDETARPLGRWILGDFRSSDFGDRRRLSAMEPCVGAFTFKAPDGGFALDFSLTVFGLPIASIDIAESLLQVAGSDLHSVPAKVRGYGDYRFLQCMREIDCVDETRSRFDLVAPNAAYPELCGQYGAFEKLVVDPARIPEDAHFFFASRWRVRPIVSAQIRDILLRVKLLGVSLKDAN